MARRPTSSEPTVDEAAGDANTPDPAPPAGEAAADAPQGKPIEAIETAARPIGDSGHALDAHGLPLNGPARARALEGRPDPGRHTMPDAPSEETK